MRMDQHQLHYYAMNVTLQQNPIIHRDWKTKLNETDTSTKQQKEGRQLVSS